MENYNSLSLLIILPLVLGVLSVISPKALQRAYAIVGSVAVLLITLFQGANILFSTTAGDVIDQRFQWLPAMGSTLSLRLDSVSAWFVLMNAVVAVIAFSLRGNWFRKFPRLYSFLGFSLVAFLNGAFLSTDLIFFYLFYEAVFIPMIFIVGIWGESAKATAVLKFFLMSLSGSILMLVSIFYLMSMYYTQTGQYSSNVLDLIEVAHTSGQYQTFWCGLGFFLAFAIKVPLVPFHGWLKDVYTLAPMPATIWLSAILSKLGVFGFIRFVGPLFGPVGTEYQPFLLCLAAISVIYPAFLAIRASDPKTLLAYSSISHLGFVMMGVFSLKPEGASAAVLLSVGHTLASAVLFYILHLIQERKGNVDLHDVQGLAATYPVLFVLTFIAVLASVSLPGTLNFAGEFLVLLEAFSFSHTAVVIAGLGVILGALYMLKFYQQLGLGSLFKGPTETQSATVDSSKDIGLYDFAVVSLVLLIIIVLGFQPIWILKGNV